MNKEQLNAWALDRAIETVKAGSDVFKESADVVGIATQYVGLIAQAASDETDIYGLALDRAVIAAAQAGKIDAVQPILDLAKKFFNFVYIAPITDESNIEEAA